MGHIVATGANPRQTLQTMINEEATAEQELETKLAKRHRGKMHQLRLKDRPTSIAKRPRVEGEQPPLNNYDQTTYGDFCYSKQTEPTGPTERTSRAKRHRKDRRQRMKNRRRGVSHAYVRVVSI